MSYFNWGSDMTKVILKTTRLAVVCGIERRLWESLEAVATIQM